MLQHTAPQHRHFLSYEGIGHGTVFERQKQFSKYRAANAAANLMDHRMRKARVGEKSLIEKKTQNQQIKTKYAYDRVVEDMIQEAMRKGEFNNLKGTGKPLPTHQTSYNPYVDFVTHKLNQVLIDNGFTPEWIMLQKEIREGILKLKRNLYKERTQLDEYPFKNESDVFKWQAIVKKYEKDVEQINKNIYKYNLVVPILQTQKIFFSLAKEAQKILEFGQTLSEVEEIHKIKKTAPEKSKNIFSFLESFLLKNRRY